MTSALRLGSTGRALSTIRLFGSTRTVCTGPFRLWSLLAMVTIQPGPTQSSSCAWFGWRLVSTFTRFWSVRSHLTSHQNQRTKTTSNTSWKSWISYIRPRRWTLNFLRISTNFCKIITTNTLENKMKKSCRKSCHPIWEMKWCCTSMATWSTVFKCLKSAQIRLLFGTWSYWPNARNGTKINQSTVKAKSQNRFTSLQKAKLNWSRNRANHSCNTSKGTQSVSQIASWMRQETAKL